MGLVILGLGPGSWGKVTTEVKAALEGAQEVYLRTRRHPTAAHLPRHLTIHSFDHFYDGCSSLTEIHERIIGEVITLASRPKGVIYAVPGHPMVGEATVSRLLALCRERGTPVQILDGMSFIEPALSALGVDPLALGLQVLDPLDLRIDPALPALVGQVHDRKIASALKTALLNFYPEDHLVSLVLTAEKSGRVRVSKIPLLLLDRRKNFGHFTCLYIPPLPLEENLATFGGLARIISRLREPGGCPWDREQTHSSLKPYLLEEAYEALQALDEEDLTKLCEELGDLLMNILLHAQIASESGEFSIRDVIRGIGKKLIRRHPHVFGELKLTDAREVIANWEVLKGQEREDGVSMLDSIPKAMPALAYARAIYDRVAPAGFPWEEIEPLRMNMLPKDLLSEAERLTPEALGELFVALSWAARHRGIDPEEALRNANLRFLRRFSRLEKHLATIGTSITKVSPRELKSLWREATDN